MNKILQKLKSWFGETAVKKVSYKQQGYRPKRDWSIMFVLSFILILAMLSFAFYIYVEIDNNRLFVSDYDEMSKELKLDEKLIKKVVDGINSRAESLEAIKNDKNIPPDPSF